VQERQVMHSEFRNAKDHSSKAQLEEGKAVLFTMNWNP
jgi:hypothetical protein